MADGGWQMANRHMQIAASALSDILHHARETAPRECCGLLVGSGDSVVRTVRAANLDAAPTRYSIDPIDHFRAIRGARADGLEVVGAYHSHPASAAIPSATDIAEATSGADFRVSDCVARGRRCARLSDRRGHGRQNPPPSSLTSVVCEVSTRSRCFSRKTMRNAPGRL